MRSVILNIRISPLSSLHFRVHIPIRAFPMFILKAWRSTAFGVYGYLNFTKSAFIEHSKKFKSEDMETNIEGKNCIVTGANSGIGYATAHGLASRQRRKAHRGAKRAWSLGRRHEAKVCALWSGATVYMVCRNKEKGEAALSEIQSMTGNQNVHLEVNNAGLLECTLIKTPEGFELNFAVNVLGTYAMTELMLPLLEKAAPDARVITVSSGGMYSVPLTKDLQFSDSKFDGVLQYARNKRVQVALMEKWAKAYENKGVGFYSMHPGWAETPGVAKSLPDFSKSFSGKLRTSEEGADTIIWLALQPKEKLVSGAFYFDRAEAPKHLILAATKGSHAEIDSIVDSLRSLSGLSSLTR
ncbi:uncharacterized protein LOC131162245 isoform X3 [Malania oleifera]|uniref:uncharacterized protein LOC131162245 isoform X3 n=1 Tax=Malania oleifera TaxID=397392 RepID=UPI0025ADBFF3|nr:uncharacterized protein LOC131162245 isoform X3 [Malania oleifera]